MNANYIRQLAEATLSGSIPFPQIVGALIAQTVESYYVDYRCLQMRFYGADGGVVLAPLPLDLKGPIAADFDAEKLKAAIVASQTQGQHFTDFSCRAVAAGVMGYFVFLRGQHVCYLGRLGAQHREWFPGAQPAKEQAS